MLVPQLDLGFRQVDAQGAPIRRPRADVARLLHLPEDRCSTAVLADALCLSFLRGPSARCCTRLDAFVPGGVRVGECYLSVRKNLAGAPHSQRQDEFSFPSRSSC